MLGGTEWAGSNQIGFYGVGRARGVSAVSAMGRATNRVFANAATRWIVHTTNLAALRHRAVRIRRGRRLILSRYVAILLITDQAYDVNASCA